MIFSDYHFQDCPKNVICFHGENITESLIDKCFELDDEFFNQSYIYDRDSIKEMILNHSELCFVFFDLESNKVIGYNFLLLLKNTSYELYKQCEISYFTLGEIDIVNLLQEQTGTLFYLSTAYSISNKVYDLLSLSQNCIYFILVQLYKKYRFKVNQVFFDVVNDFDLKYVSCLSLDKIKITRYQSKIFAKNFIPKQFYKYAKYSTLLQDLYDSNI